jgi:hypothetical protein
MKKACSFVMFMILIAGCTATTDLTKPEITNMTPADLMIDPVQITYLRDRPPRFLGWTFSVFPYSVINKTEKRDANLDRELLFCLRNFIELAGYKFVKLDQHPGFLLTIDTRTFSPRNYRVVDQPFSNYWNAVNTLTWKDSFGANSFGFNNVDWQDWGEWNPPMKKGESPGYMNPKNYKVFPVSSHGDYHIVNIQVYDGRNLKEVWMVTAIAASKAGNIRTAAQTIIKYMARWFSYSSLPASDGKKGYTGIMPSILTVDGKDYYPMVSGVFEKGPAAKAGIKEYDMIVAVDSIDMRNMPIVDAMNVIKGEPDSEVELTVWRVDKLLKFKLTRALLSSFNR